MITGVSVMENINKLKKKIKKLKLKLSKMIGDDKNFNSKKVINLSQKLDELIIRFYKKGREINCN